VINIHAMSARGRVSAYPRRTCANTKKIFHRALSVAQQHHLSACRFPPSPPPFLFVVEENFAINNFLNSILLHFYLFRALSLACISCGMNQHKNIAVEELN
jgi:hypothetical protein